MVVRLHNLSARSPSMTDIESVTELMIACESAENGLADVTKKDIDKLWNTVGFTLNTDAWVIVAYRGQLVGYADVRWNEDEQLISLICVHPAYRGRGIGTLLVWLTEERARQLANSVHTDRRVVLRNIVSSRNIAAQQLLEREGYTLTHHSWRLLVDMDEAQSLDEVYYNGKLRIDLVVEVQSLLGTSLQHSRTGIYSARQYAVYEKELRSGAMPCCDESYAPLKAL